MAINLLIVSFVGQAYANEFIRTGMIKLKKLFLNIKLVEIFRDRFDFKILVVIP